MGTITTGNHPKALWPGVKTFFGNTYEGHPREYSEIFDEETSDKAYEEDVETGAFGYAVKKPQGAPFTYDGHQQGYLARYTHDLWGNGYIVTYEELKDNQYEQVSKKRSKMLAFSLHVTKETNGADILNNAFDSNYPLTSENVALISPSHPTFAGLQSNLITNAADLSEAALEDLLIQISLCKNNRGLPIAVLAQKLLVSPYDAFNAERILKSPLTTTDAGNAINAVRSTNALPQGFAVNHYFGDPDAWFVKTNAPDGLKLMQRERYQFVQDNDGDTMNAKAKAFERYRFGCTNWRAIWGSPGA